MELEIPDMLQAVVSINGTLLLASSAAAHSHQKQLQIGAVLLLLVLLLVREVSKPDGAGSDADVYVFDTRKQGL